MKAKKQNTCPMTGKPIARRYVLHSSVMSAANLAKYSRKNPREGTLRRYVAY